MMLSNLLLDLFRPCSVSGYCDRKEDTSPLAGREANTMELVCFDVVYPFYLHFSIPFIIERKAQIEV
jgi:hypothetical protein